ncbi:hypothetical protein, conserved [Eimeria acervulina]|uniref:Uncharacterized protein n=1 Tax=Eimeria acervulina TaxID=5801 RepID=U6GWG3_EIMAC|nr:hypothetical protein, conserved [Eimeria acervulina]CDI83598.1 hypothetical protein, conserved [Eimeria acervulina]
MINEMQEELGSAQTHLTRFAKIFEEAGGHQEQVARDSPAVESLKVRPVSPVSHLVSRSSGCSKCVYQQVEKDIEAAREAHTENDDFDDW